MEDSNKIEEDKKEHKISVALKKDTIELLDEIARKKVDQALEEGSFDIINLIRSKRGRGISYDFEINFLARIYIKMMDGSMFSKDFINDNLQLKKVLYRLNEINNSFFKTKEQEDEKHPS